MSTYLETLKNVVGKHSRRAPHGIEESEIELGNQLLARLSGWLHVSRE
jgi:hypothetical protein